MTERRQGGATGAERTRQRRRDGTTLRWIALCAVAELLGIGAAAAWYGAMNVIVGEPEAIAARLGAWLLMALAAIPEGVILGGLQVLGLRWFFARVSAARWILATTALGFLGWGIGAFIPLFVVGEPATGGEFAEPGLATTAAFAAVFGVAVGALFGLAQSTALPRAARRRWSWVLANAAGWMLGLPAIYVAAQVAADLSGTLARVALWCAGGVVAGALIGAATALSLQVMRSED